MPSFVERQIPTRDAITESLGAMAAGPRTSGGIAVSPVTACRFCGAPLHERFADLGLTPFAGALVPPGAAAERFYPLRALVCSDCRLVQLAETEAPPGQDMAVEGFSPELARERRDWAACMVRQLRLGAQTPVLELAAPDAALADALRQAGVPVTTIEAGSGFGGARARRLRAMAPPPALIVANDLLARAGDPHGLLEGVRDLLAPGGVASFETPHLLNMVEDRALGVLRHGRTLYASLLVAELMLGLHGLVVFEAEALPAGGGTLRLLARHVEDTTKPVGASVARLRAAERRAGLETPEAYARFARGVVETKCELLDFLVGARRGGRRVAAYGASADGVTVLNYAGVGPELLTGVADPDPARQGMLLPGLCLPVCAPAALLAERPDFLLILPWWRAEAVMAEMAAIRAWGGRFVVATPRLRVL